MKFKSLTVAMTIATGLAIPSLASALTVTSIEGVWQTNSRGVSGAGSNEIRWGRPAGQGKSGYVFEGTETDFEAEADTGFVLGSFTHLNFPIYGPFLERVDLAVSFTIDGLNDVITSVFSFAHDETLNRARNCANGQRRGTGVNVNGCADHVTATLNEAKSESFFIDGVEHVLDVSGLMHNGQAMTDFWTVEEAENSAFLMAEFRVLSGENPQPPTNQPPLPPTTQPPLPPVSEVPLPASGLLLLAGLVGLFVKGRRS